MMIDSSKLRFKLLSARSELEKELHTKNIGAPKHLVKTLIEVYTDVLKMLTQVELETKRGE